MRISKLKLPSTALLFTGGSLIKTFTGMAVSLIAIKLIGPEKLGLWQAALLIKPYVGFLQLGLTQGIGRELPFLMGGGKHGKVKEYASTAQFITSFYTFSCLVIAFYFMIFHATGIEKRLIFLTAGIFIATMFIDNYLSSTYRSSQSFKDLSKVYIITSIFEILLIPLIYFYGFSGYMLTLFFHSLFSTVLLICFRPIKVKSIFNKKIYFKSIKVGFPLMILNFITSIPDTYPRLFILFFLSTTALGLTAPANAALSVFMILPASLMKYVYPKMTYNFGKSLDRSKLWKTNKKLIFLLTGIGIFSLPVAFLVPYALENFFPKYEEAISITILAIFIGVLRTYSILNNVFNTLKSYSVQFKVALGRNIFYLTFPLVLYFLSPQDQQLESIFLGILFAEIFSSSVLIYFVYKVTHEESKEGSG